MENIKPKTYNEILRKKKCYELLKFYDVEDNVLVDIYEFLGLNDNTKVTGSKSRIILYEGKNIMKVYDAVRRTDLFEGVEVTNEKFKVIPLFDPKNIDYDYRD